MREANVRKKWPVVLTVAIVAVVAFAIWFGGGMLLHGIRVMHGGH